MSPEILAHAMDDYVESLQLQARAAEAFFFGRVGDGVEGLRKLPSDIRDQIDHLIFEASGGEAIDPTETASNQLIAHAILHSLEERMGMHG